MSKYLISEDYVAIRKGAFVEASEDAGEFLLDEDTNLALATLQEIAEANDLEISKKLKKDEYVDALLDGLAELDIPSQNKPTESQIVASLVAEGVDAGLSDDEILIKIVTGGVSFKRATRLFKQAMESQGLRISPKDRKEQAIELMTGEDFNPETWGEVEAMAARLSEEIKDTNEKQAIAAIRSYCKSNSIAMPARAKGQRGAVGFKKKAFDWMVANPNASNDDLVAFLEENERKPAAIKSFGAIFDLCKRFAEAA